MPSIPSEVKIMRTHTDILIRRFPTPLTILRPRVLTSDGQGGVSRQGSGFDTLRPQTFFVSGLNSNGRSLTAARWDITEQGERFIVRYVVVGRHDADLREDDEFVLGGRRFKVQSVFPDNQFERKGEAVTLDG